MLLKIVLTLALFESISCLDSKAYTDWYKNRVEGSILPALEVDCDWVLPDAGIVQKSYTVVCPSNCLNVEHCIHVKGSGPYAVHSPVCLSAIHAGVIQAQQGGAVEVSVTDGQKSYAASNKNGISSIPYGSYFASFNVKKSDVNCGPTPTLPPTPAPCISTAVLDLVFIADSSRSVGKENFLQEKAFIQDLVSSFHMSQTESRAGLITFNTNPKTRFRLETYNSNAELATAIDAVPYQAGGTFLSKALSQAKANMLFRNDERVHKFVIVFTDGRLFVEDKIVPPIKSLVAEGANIIVLGVGNQAEDVLLQVADGKKENIFEAETYEKLRLKLTSLVEKICAFVLPRGSF